MPHRRREPAELCGCPYKPFKEKNIDEETIVKSFYVAAGVGQVVASRAFIAGAAGGCQAEIGTASAMAAAALAYIKGGGVKEISAAAGAALQNLMGLVCDPLQGLWKFHA